MGLINPIGSGLSGLGDGDWLSTYDSLVDFNNVKPLRQKDGQRFFEWVQQEVERLLLTNSGQFCLLVDAGLRYDWWKSLQNSTINQSVLPFSNETMFEKERLRVIRVNHSDDVPHYDIISSKAQDSFNRHSGLFGCPEGFYYSVGLRPDTIRANLKLTKIDYPSKLIMKQQAVELIVLGCVDEAEKNKLAEMVHNLRRANLTFKASTSQPFPLHLMNTIKKYWQAQVVTTKNELELESNEYDLDDRIERDIIMGSDIPKKKYGILRKKNI